MNPKRKLWRIGLSVIYLLYERTKSLFGVITQGYTLIAPLPYAFGNLNEEIKLGLLASELTKKKLIIFLPPKGVFSRLFQFKHCNLCLHEACMRYSISSAGYITFNTLYIIYVIIFVLYRGIYLILREAKKYDRDLEKELTTELSYYLSFPRIGIGSMWQDLLSSKLDCVDINKLEIKIVGFLEEIENVCKLQIKRYGLENLSFLDQPIVVCHVRTNYYYKDGNRRNRNANIEDYIDGLRRIISKKDYTVVVIGDPNSLEKKIDGKIINVPNIYLDEGLQRAVETLSILKCSFFIGTQSGPSDFAMLVGVDSIILNSIDLSTTECTLWSKTIQITKPINKIDSNSFWQDYHCDLNDPKNSFNIFKYSSDQETTTSILDCLAQALNTHPIQGRSGLKDYYSDKNSELMEEIIESLKEIENLEIIQGERIYATYSKLVSCWEAKLNANKPKYYTDYYSEEIMRIRARRKFSKTKKAKAFLDIT